MSDLGELLKVISKELPPDIEILVSSDSITMSIGDWEQEFNLTGLSAKEIKKMIKFAGKLYTLEC